MSPITVRDLERLVVHIAADKGEFLDKRSKAQARLMKDLHVIALCGEKCRIGGLIRETPTCMICIARQP